MSANKLNPLTPALSRNEGEGAKLDRTPARMCPCGKEELLDWRPVGPACFNTADFDDRKELKLYGKRTSRTTVKRLLDHAASRANAQRL